MSNSLDLFKKGLEGNKDSSGEKQAAGNDLNLTTVSDKTPKKPETQATAAPKADGEPAPKFQPTVQSAFTIKEGSNSSDKPKDEGSWVSRFAGGAWDEGVSTVKAVAEIVGGKQSDIDERLRTTQIGPAGKANVIGNISHSGADMASSVKLMGGALGAKAGWVEDKQEYQTFRQAAGEFKDRLLSGDADAMGHATTFVGSLFVGGGLVGKGSKAGSSMRELQVAAKGWQEIGAADAALGSARAFRTATTRVGDDILNVARTTELKGGTSIADLSLAGRGAQVMSKEGGVFTALGDTKGLTASTLNIGGDATGAAKLAGRIDGLPLAGTGNIVEQGGVKFVGVDSKVGGLASKVDGLTVATERVVPVVDGKGGRVVGLADQVAGKTPSVTLNVSEHATPVVKVGDQIAPVVKVGDHVAPVVKAGDHVAPVAKAGDHVAPVVKAGESSTLTTNVGRGALGGTADGVTARKAINTADHAATHQALVTQVGKEAQQVSATVEAVMSKVTGANAAQINQDLAAVSRTLTELGTAGGDDVQRMARINERLVAIEKAGGKAIVDELRPSLSKLDGAVTDAKWFDSARYAVNVVEQNAVSQAAFSTVKGQAGEIASSIESKMATVTGKNAAQIKQDLGAISRTISEIGTVGDDAQRIANINERLAAIEKAGGKSLVDDLRPALGKFDQAVAEVQPFKSLHNATTKLETTAQEISTQATKLVAKADGPQAQLIRTELENIADKARIAATRTGDEATAAAESVRQSLANVERAGGADLVRELKQSVAKFNQGMSEAGTAQTKVNEIVARATQPMLDDAARIVQPAAKTEAVSAVTADAVKADVVKAGTQQAVARLEQHSVDISSKAEALAKTVTGPNARQIQDDLQTISRTARELGTAGDDAARIATIEQKVAAIQKAEGGAAIVNELRPVIGKIDDTVAHVEQMRKVENAVVRTETAASDVSKQAVTLAEKVEGPNAQAIKSELDKIRDASKNISGSTAEAQSAAQTIRQSTQTIRANGGTAIADALEQNVARLERTVQESSAVRSSVNFATPLEAVATTTAKPFVNLSDDMVRAQRQAFTRVEQSAQTLEKKAATLSETVTGRNAAKLQDDLNVVSQTAKNLGKTGGDDAQRMSVIKERLAQIEQTPGGASLARELRPMVGQVDDAVAKAQPFKALEGSAARVEVASNEVGNTALRLAEKVEGPNAQIIRDELQKINSVARTESGSVAKIQESMAKIESHGGTALLDDLRGPVAKLDTAVADANRMKSLTNATVKVETQSAEISQKASQLAVKLDGPNAKVIEDHLAQIQKTATKISEGTIDEAQGLNRIQQHMAVIETKGGASLVSDLKPMVSNLDRSVVEAQGLRNTVSQASKVEAISSNVAAETRRIAATLGDDAKSVTMKERLGQIEESSVRAVQAGENPQAHIANINKNIAQIEAQGGTAAVKDLRAMVNNLETAQSYRTLEQSVAKVEAQAGNISRESSDLAARVNVSTQAGQVVKEQLQVMSRTADDIIAHGDKSGALVKSLNQSLATIEANGGAEIAAGLRRSLTDLNEAVATSKQTAVNLFNHHSASIDTGFNVLRSQGHMAAQADLVADMRAHIQMMRYLAPTDAALLTDLSKAEYHLSRAQSVANILSVSPEVARATTKQLAALGTDLAQQKQLILGLQSDSWVLRQMARPYQFVQTMVIGLSKEPMLVLKTGLGMFAPEASVASAAMWGAGGAIFAADAARAYTLYRSYQQRDAELSAQHIQEYNKNTSQAAEVRSDDPRYQAVPKNRQEDLRLSPNTEALIRPSGVVPTATAEVNGIAANNPNAKLFNDNLIATGRQWGTWGLFATPNVVEDVKPVVANTPQQHRHARTTGSKTETPQDKREKTAFSYFTVTQRAMDINTQNSLMASLGGAGRRDGKMPSSLTPYSGAPSRSTQVDFRQITHYSGLAEGRNTRDYKDLKDVEESETGVDRPGSGIGGGGTPGTARSQAGGAQLATGAQDPNNPNGQNSTLGQAAQSPTAQATQDEENAPQVTV